MKKKSIAIILAFFLGGIGIHKFYLGETKKGLLYLFFCWTGIPMILAFVDFILLLVESQTKFDEKYNSNVQTVAVQAKYPDAEFFLEGVLSNLYVYEKKVIIDRSKGTVSKVLNGFAGEKTIPMKAIQSIQFKAAGTGLNGFIQFGILGGVEQKGGILANTQDENTVFFTPDKNELAKTIQDYIEAKIY